MSLPPDSVISMLLSGTGEYLLVRTEEFGGITSWLISPVIPDGLRGKPLDDLRYPEVLNFLDAECVTNIPLHPNVGPFQWGLRYRSIREAIKVTGVSSKFLFAALNTGLSDYYELARLYKQLATDEDNKQ